MTQKQNFARYPGYIMFALVDDPAHKAGWDILDLITGDQIESRQEAIGVAQAYEQGGGSNYTNSPMTLDGNRNFVVRKTQFLMGRKEVDVVGELNSKVSAAEKRAKEAEDKVKPIGIEASGLKDRISAMEADRDRALKERTTLTTTKDKLEADMGKLKRVLGEKVINDVLNPANG